MKIEIKKSELEDIIIKVIKSNSLIPLDFSLNERSIFCVNDIIGIVKNVVIKLSESNNKNK
jgi:hypothetical protein